MTQNKGQFKPGNKAREKPKLCPYCHKQLNFRIYVYPIKKEENSRLIRQQEQQEKVL